MNRELVEKVVNAVLYEGYILYPYRASSKKNRERFTFGRVYPEDYSIAQNGAEPFVMQTECLVRDESKDALNKYQCAFSPSHGAWGRILSAPITEMPEVEPKFEIVPDLQSGRTTLSDLAGGGGAEGGAGSVSSTAPRRCRTSLTFHHRALEPVRGDDGKISAIVVRRQDAIRGVIEVATQPVDDSVFKMTVRIVNRTAVSKAGPRKSERHHHADVYLHPHDSTGAGRRMDFLTDPPPTYANAVAACKNIGAWPVLVGEESKGERDAMLSSPIILYDYPQIAPESPGDLFDGLEIDEILTLQ